MGMWGERITLISALVAAGATCSTAASYDPWNENPTTPRTTVTMVQHGVLENTGTSVQSFPYYATQQWFESVTGDDVAAPWNPPFDVLRFTSDYEPTSGTAQLQPGWGYVIQAEVFLFEDWQAFVGVFPDVWPFPLVLQRSRKYENQQVEWANELYELSG